MTIAESNESKGFDLEHILWHIFNANSTVPSMFKGMCVCMYVCAIYWKSVILFIRAVHISFTCWKLPDICFLLKTILIHIHAVYTKATIHQCIELRASNKDHIILLRPSHWKCLFSLPSLYMKLYLIIKLLRFIPSCLAMNIISRIHTKNQSFNVCCIHYRMS